MIFLLLELVLILEIVYGWTAIKKSGNTVIDQFRNRLKTKVNNHICTFPEGTTSNGKYLLKFRRGAFVLGEPVKPVVIKFPSKNFSPCWESIKAPYHLFRVLTQFVNYCEMQFLPVYNPSEEEKKDPALYAENVRKYMAKHSGLLLSESSVEEKKEYLELIRGEKLTKLE